MKIIELYWDRKRIIYRNGDIEISREEALRKAEQKEYSGVSINWDGSQGPISIKVYQEMQRMKSELEALF